MCLELRRINHDGLGLCLSGSQAVHHPGEDSPGAPALPTVVERLMWTVFPGRIVPAQAVPIDKNDATQHTAVINADSTVALLEKGPQTLYLFVRQPK